MARPSYTEEQLHFLHAFRMFPMEVVTAVFNSYFGTDKKAGGVHSTYSRYQIKRTRGVPTTRKVWSKERVNFLRENYPKMVVADLTAAFNAKFGTSISAVAMHGACGRFGIHSGRTGCFEKGQVSWNKGVKGYMGANATSFKKGSAPPNRKPLWSERLDPEYGFIVMKVPETDPYTGFPTRYKSKHVWIWEQINGPLPESSVIIFVDSNRFNFEPENLLCIHRNVLLLLNLHKYTEAPPELKPSILALAKLEAEAGIRSTGRAPGAGRKRKASC